MSMATARNLLYYTCDADFVAVGIPIAAKQSLCKKCFRRIFQSAGGEQGRQAASSAEGTP